MARAQSYTLARFGYGRRAIAKGVSADIVFEAELKCLDDARGWNTIRVGVFLE